MRGGSVVATNITKEYGATVVLDRVSLTVPPGARIGVVGPNGSGKSTLLRVLAGVDEPSAGRVERIGTVGYLPQEAERRQGETLLGFLARRTGVAAAEARMRARRRSTLSTSSSRSAAEISSRARGRSCARARDRGSARRRAADALRRRSGARLARGVAALPLRRALPGRADERPRLRRPRAARAVRASASPDRSSSCPTTARSSIEP